jgi:hypothetical protein
MPAGVEVPFHFVHSFVVQLLVQVIPELANRGLAVDCADVVSITLPPTVWPKAGIHRVNSQPLLHLAACPEQARAHSAYWYSENPGGGLIRLVFDVDELHGGSKGLVETRERLVERGAEVDGCKQAIGSVFDHCAVFACCRDRLGVPVIDFDPRRACWRNAGTFRQIVNSHRRQSLSGSNVCHDRYARR